jgi:hypothetical protein
MLVMFFEIYLIASAFDPSKKSPILERDSQRDRSFSQKAIIKKIKK